MANEFGNFATLDPLVSSLIPNTAISNGSNTIITASDPGGDYWCHQSTLTFPVKNGLKIVCEMTYVNDVDSGSVSLGIKGQGYETPSSDADHLWYNSASGRGMINNENSESGASYTTGHVIRMEIDASASDGEMSVESVPNVTPAISKPFHDRSMLLSTANLTVITSPAVAFLLISYNCVKFETISLEAISIIPIVGVPVIIYIF